MRAHRLKRDFERHILNNIRDWLGALVPLVNLTLILLAAIKILNKAERDFDERARQIADFELRIRRIETDRDLFIQVGAKVDAISAELERIRTRLDKLLDQR